MALPHVVIPVNPIAKDLIMCKEHTAHATVWQKEDMEASFTKIITLTEGMDEKLSLITWCPNTLKQKARSLVFTHLWSIWNETDLCQEKSPSRRWGFNLNEWWVSIWYVVSISLYQESWPVWWLRESKSLKSYCHSHPSDIPI